MSDSFDLLTIFHIIRKWKKPILIACALAVLGSVIITMPFIMPPYYKSRVIFYASNPALTDRHNLFRTQAGDIPISSFGEEEDVDRLLSIAKSGNIPAFAIQKYNLFEHYNIDPKGELPYYKANKEFEDNYKAIKNDLGAIEIHVSDKDSLLAAQMANDIMDKIDQINIGMIRDNDAQVLKLFEEKMNEKKKNLLATTDSLIIARQRNSSASLILMEKQYDNTIKDMNTLSTLYEQYKTAGNKDISTIYVVERAYPSEKKDKPIRWLIVVASVLITFFLSAVIAVIFERTREK